MKLEKMDEFFNVRQNGYEEHQLNNIECAKEFYASTARQLPKTKESTILDLGCGTGLELDEYYNINPYASVTGIDLAKDMLNALKEKFPNKKLTLINESYFNVPFGEGVYDAVVSVESLHHFTMEEKIPLYRMVHDALKEDGYLILTDYIIEDEKKEAENFKEFARLKSEQGITDEEFYHYDTPLTNEHETKALLAAGFSKVETLYKWGNTQMLKACR